LQNWQKRITAQRFCTESVMNYRKRFWIIELKFYYGGSFL
jgi:hypothetical protein